MRKIARVFVGVAALAMCFAVAAPTQAATKVTSTYVTLDSDNCESLENTDPDVDQDRFLCGSVAGWSVIFNHGKTADSITLRTPGKDTPLESTGQCPISSRTWANDMSFECARVFRSARL
jgi:hypothetical protein